MRTKGNNYLQYLWWVIRERDRHIVANVAVLVIVTFVAIVVIHYIR